MQLNDLRALFGKPPLEAAPAPEVEESLFEDDPVKAPWSAWIRLRGRPWKLFWRGDSYEEGWSRLLPEHPPGHCEKMVIKTGRDPGE